MYDTLCKHFKELASELPSVITKCSYDEDKSSVSFVVPLSEFPEGLKAQISINKMGCYATYGLNENIGEDFFSDTQALVNRANALSPDLNDRTGEIIGGFALNRNRGCVIYVRKLAAEKAITESDVTQMVTIPVLAYRKWEKAFAAILHYGFPADVAELMMDDQ